MDSMTLYQTQSSPQKIIQVDAIVMQVGLFWGKSFII